MNLIAYTAKFAYRQLALSLLLATAISASSIYSPAAIASQMIKVGVYNNPPITTLGKNGHPSGLALDILEQIAKAESWNLHYVYGNWNRITTLLKQGKLDIVAGMPFNNNLGEKLYLNSEAIANNWGVVYRNPVVNITSVFDLKNKRVALIKHNTHSAAFKTLLREFGIDYTPIYVTSYYEALRATDNGRADAAVVNRLFSLLHARSFDVAATTIVFNPVEIHFASPKSIGRRFLHKIDYHLVLEKEDASSYYYTAVKRWLSIPSGQKFPTWLIWVLALAFVAAVSTFIINWILRRQVKQRSKALEQSELRFRKLSENIHQVFWMASPDLSEFQYVSPAFEQIWGKSRNELYANSALWFDAIHPLDRAQVRSRITKVCLNLHSGMTFKFRIGTSNTTPKWIQLQTYPVFDDDNKLTNYFGIAEDITQTEKTQNDLRKTESLLYTIMDHSPALIASFDLDGHITMVNRQFEILFNTKQNDLLGKNLYKLLPHDMAEQINNNNLNAIENVKPVTNKETWIHRDGNPHEYLCIRFPLLNDAGKPYNICAIGIDVTEQVQAQERLRQFEKIVGASRDLMAFIDKNTIVKAINEAHLTAFGKQAKEIIGKPICQLYTDKFYKKNILLDIKKCLAGKSIRRQYWINLPNAGNRFLDVSYHPYYSEHKEISGVVVDMHDLTDMKNVTKELQTHRDHLEHLINKRTLALENANKELEAFSYSIAHDLRSPLRSITSFSQLLIDESDSSMAADTKTYLDRVVAASIYMSELIDDILGLAKISRSEFKPSSVNMSEIGQQIFHSLTTAEPDRIVEFKIESDLQVNGDSRLICVALENLIRNAWKYTGKKHKAKIIFASKTKNKKSIFYIKDNGAGFDMHYVNKLFKPFQRLHSKEEFEGTGIGLATVQRVIQRHGGEVWCDAKENRGATFYFTLP